MSKARVLCTLGMGAPMGVAAEDDSMAVPALAEFGGTE